MTVRDFPASRRVSASCSIRRHETDGRARRHGPLQSVGAGLEFPGRPFRPCRRQQEPPRRRPLEGQVQLIESGHDHGREGKREPRPPRQDRSPFLARSGCGSWRSGLSTGSPRSCPTSILQAGNSIGKTATPRRLASRSSIRRRPERTGKFRTSGSM
ncbi:MAG: hypothetical protein MZV70_44930 [Desulfobacterales bacterium]|nr:hypothetical protein [Desulfobacterales bacterium]